MSNFIEIPLPQTNPLDVIIDCGAVTAAPKAKKGKTKTEEAPAPVESAE